MHKYVVSTTLQTTRFSGSFPAGARGEWIAYCVLPVSVAPERLATNRYLAIGDAPRAIVFCDGVVVDHAPDGSVGADANAFRPGHDGIVIFHFDDHNICDVMADRVGVA